MTNNDRQLEDLQLKHKQKLEREPDQQFLDAYTMDEIMHEIIGQSYADSLFDDRGCYMGRGQYRLEPKGIVEAVRLALNAMDILLEPPHTPITDEEE